MLTKSTKERELDNCRTKPPPPVGVAGSEPFRRCYLTLISSASTSKIAFVPSRSPPWGPSLSGKVILISRVSPAFTPSMPSARPGMYLATP